ncbi:MAG TPA: YhcH/YjgK/YiaL family protein [Candidatus Deferrimicrobium sp.]|nr:YhcH/YjgK/YiaL family protein [Candidatus Deferrimicrobium sp.]
MIIDQLSNAGCYFSLGGRMEKALRYLQETSIAALPPGKYEIAGKYIYATIQESCTKPLEQGFWEAHRQYIDIHCVIEGAERIGYAPIDHLQEDKYDEEKDLVLFQEGEGAFYTALPGTFVIMMPQDAHMPGIALKYPRPIKKLVIKIAVFS